MNQQTSALFIGARTTPTTAAHVEEVYLTGNQIEQVFKISASHRLYLDSLGMPHISVGGNRRRYLRSEVEQFLRSRDSGQEST
jgi:hypothetical protein